MNNIEIKNLNLSTRAYNCLKKRGINTIEQLEKLTDYDLERIRGMGMSCCVEVRRKLNEFQFDTGRSKTVLMYTGKDIENIVEDFLAKHFNLESVCLNEKSKSDLERICLNYGTEMVNIKA